MVEEKTTHDGMELRSEKVRKLLGDVPSPLMRWGTLVIVIVFAALAAAVCILPYPGSDGETILEYLSGE